jgi:hypothetical protein
MLREVAGFLDDVRAERKRMKREGYAKHELQATSRVIHDISASLQRLKPLAHAAPPIHDSETAYDDIPADLDAFRDALARRIEAFFASRPDAGAAARADDDGAAEARP